MTMKTNVNEILIMKMKILKINNENENENNNEENNENVNEK